MSGSPEQRNRTALLREFLHDTDAPCPLCGYNLRQLTANRCPECGQELELRVGAVNVRTGLLVAAIAPLMMMFGLAVFFAILWMRLGSPGGVQRRWVLLSMMAGVVEGVLAGVLYRRRRWFLLLPAVRQKCIVLTCWLVTGVVFSSAAVLIR